MIKEGSSWYNIYPVVTVGKTPRNMSNGFDYLWEYQPMAKVIESWLYSDSEIEQARHVLLYPYDYASTTATWSQHILYSNALGNVINTTTLFTTET